MRDRDRILAIAMIAVIATGLVISFIPGLYTYDVSFEERDGTVSYEFNSNVGIDTNAVMIGNTGLFDVEEVFALLDPAYATLNDYDKVSKMLEGLSIHLSARGVSMHVVDAQGMVDRITSADPSGTAMLIATGSIPYVLYDGPRDCPLTDWLDRGGVLISVATTLGKYVSNGPESSDIVESEGYGTLFAGVGDEEFMYSEQKMLANAGCNESVRDALNFYMNEYTHGIRAGSIPDSINLGYVSDDGYSAACAFRSGNGMIMNFGVSIGSHEHFNKQVAQIIASGIDYGSEILEVQIGNTRGDRSGSFEVTRTCVIYAFVGFTDAVYAEKYVPGGV